MGKRFLLSASGACSFDKSGREGSKRKSRASLLEQCDVGDTARLEQTNQALQLELERLQAQLQTVAQAHQIEATKFASERQAIRQQAQASQTESEKCKTVIAAKDTLIQKLTFAVDCQLDKVDGLESKLQRAEEEFCKVEDEMQELEN